MADYNWLYPKQEWGNDTDRVLKYIDKKDWNGLDKNVVAQCIAKQGGLQERDLSKGVRTIKRSKAFEETKEQIKKDAKAQFTTSGLMIVMTGTVTLFFISDLIQQSFLLFNIWIEGILGALAMVLLVRNLLFKHRLVQRYELGRDFLLLDIASFILCILVRLTFLQAGVNLDTSLLILFLDHFFARRKFNKSIDEM